MNLIMKNIIQVPFFNHLGIERRTQTAGESKDWSDPFKAQNEEDKAIRQKLLNALHINFKNQVKNSRGDKLKAPDSTLFNGHVWVGQEAVDLGKDFYRYGRNTPQSHLLSSHLGGQLKRPQVH